MAGYIKGSRAWYDFVKARLVEISAKLQDSNIAESLREALYNEQCRLVVELDEYGESFIGSSI